MADEQRRPAASSGWLGSGDLALWLEQHHMLSGPKRQPWAVVAPGGHRQERQLRWPGALADDLALPPQADALAGPSGAMGRLEPITRETSSEEQQ